MKKKVETKICANPKCNAEFVRRPGEITAVWNRRIYCCRECSDLAHYNKSGKKKKKIRKGAYMGNRLKDACDRYIGKVREEVDGQVIVYSSEFMTQKELKALIPSERGK